MAATPEVQKYFNLLIDKRYKEAEELLRILRSSVDTSKKGRGYWQALEGLLLTCKANGEKSLYLKAAISSREGLNEARREFTDHARNPLHDDYDRGYFEALLDYIEELSSRVEGKV
ncbi:MAG: hypothetical protein QW390_01970 [Candidatus Bathyarchaeia archaeon]